MRICKKVEFESMPVGGSHVVWFKNSRKFLMLDEPAFMALQMRADGKTTKSILETCNLKYAHLLPDTYGFVIEALALFSKLNRKTPVFHSPKEPANCNQKPINYKHTVTYGFGDIHLCFYYQDDFIKDFFHPLFSHLQTDGNGTVIHHIRCYRTVTHWVYQFGENRCENFDSDDEEYYKGAVLQRVYSLVCNRNPDEWMCTLHASGVFRENRAVIFSAVSGCGKSTVAAILKACGFGYIADDFIAANCEGKIFPFPASISVKDGAVKVMTKYYPELRQKQAEMASTGKIARYLPVNYLKEESHNGIPVKCFVFVDYKKNSGFSLVPVEKKDALSLLLSEIWVNPETAFIRAFFNWVNTTPFYRMTYSDNEIMAKSIEKLLGNEE